MLLLLRAGFRVGDVGSLTVADIEFGRGRVRCRSGKCETNAWLPMTDSVAVALQEHLTQRSETLGNLSAFADYMAARQL